MTSKLTPNSQTPAAVYLDPMDKDDAKTETGSMNTQTRTRSVTPLSISERDDQEENTRRLSAALIALGIISE